MKDKIGVKQNRMGLDNEWSRLKKDRQLWFTLFNGQVRRGQMRGGGAISIENKKIDQINYGGR